MEMFHEIKRWHTAPKPHGRGWKDIGYHFVVFPDGQYVTGRDPDTVGAHVLHYNEGRLGVLMIERAKVSRIGKFHDYFNEKQRGAVRQIARTFGITKITGHNDYAPRLCPGFKVKADFFL